MSDAPVHSLLPPSSAHRWTVCTASVQFILDSGIEDSSSVYADEGTIAHAHAAEWLKTGKEPVIPSSEMCDHVKSYVDFVVGKKLTGDVHYVERRVRLFYYPEQRGTVDDALFNRKRLYISDFKYGAGVGVYAENNKQLAIYAESLLQELEVITDIPDDLLITMAIFQPRDRNDSNPVRLWALTRAQLRQFCQSIQVKASIILRGGTTQFLPNPDEQCRFCPAKGVCQAYTTYGLEVLPNHDVVELPDARVFPRDKRVRVLKAKKQLVSWLESLEDQEMTDLLNDAPGMGFKLVEGKSNRQWSDEKVVKQLLSNYLKSDEITPPGDIISPAQVEKLLKGVDVSTKFSNKLEKLIVKPEGKPTMVPEDDKRPALVKKIPFQDLNAAASVI